MEKLDDAASEGVGPSEQEIAHAYQMRQDALEKNEAKANAEYLAVAKEPDPTPEPQQVQVIPTVATIGVAWTCPKDKGGCGSQMGANNGKVMVALSRGMGVMIDCKCGKKLGVSLIDPDAPKIVSPGDPRVRACFGLKR